jgi:glutamine synthetase
MNPTLTRTKETPASENGGPPEQSRAERELRESIASGEIREIEVHWSDHQGHARGKRINAADFLRRAGEGGFAFCDAVLTWDIVGDVKPGLRLTDWETGYPDLYAIPDLSSFRKIPWREGAGFVTADLVDHHGALIRTAPRTVLRRAVERLAALGYSARVGVEIEFHLLNPDGTPLADGLQAYSLQKLNELDPTIGEILDGLRGFVDLESGQTEYGPGQVEANLLHADALEAADQAARFKYAAREIARRSGALATFMAKPFGDQAGHSGHLHVSLWKDGKPAFAPTSEGAENDVHRTALGGIVEHLPGIVLYGSPTVNSYKRFEEYSFAPDTATWGGDNRTVAVRSLIEGESSTRIELRTGAADAQPHWSIAGLLAAVAAGIEDGAEPGERGEGNLYGQGDPLPHTLQAGYEAARADKRITEILGDDAVHDYTRLAELEWLEFVNSVTDWDRERYLRTV